MCVCVCQEDKTLPLVERNSTLNVVTRNQGKCTNYTGIVATIIFNIVIIILALVVQLNPCMIRM